MDRAHAAASRVPPDRTDARPTERPKVQETVRLIPFEWSTRAGIQHVLFVDRQRLH